MKQFQAELNADWGNNIVITGEFENEETARKSLDEIKDLYGDPEIGTKIVKIEEV